MAEGAGRQAAHLIRMQQGRQFAFGGLRERWHDGERRVDTFTIITVEPNELCAKVHDRMPLILREADFAAWLDPDKSAEQLTALLKPYTATEMESFPVSKLVSSPGNDTADCVKPIDKPAVGRPAEEKDLFSWNRS